MRPDASPKIPIGHLLMMVALIGGVGTAATASADAPAVTFRRHPDGLQIQIGGKPFARYQYGNEKTTRPFFESIHAPDGSPVTRNHPPVEGQDPTDHATFHPGLWLAFGDLNGADNWRNVDRVQHVDFVDEPREGPGRGTFAVRNRYEKSGHAIAEEICRITIEALPTGTLMLWDSVFRPLDGELIFGDQEEMGLGVRLATPLTVTKGGRIIDSAGRINEAQVWGKSARWCAYERQTDGRRPGVLLLPHPENFRPSWFHARDYGLLVANPFGQNAFTGGEKSRVVVKHGESLRLRFGVLISSDMPDPDASYRHYLREANATRDR